LPGRAGPKGRFDRGMTSTPLDPVLTRIQAALQAADVALRPFLTGAVASSQKPCGRGPVTEADRAVDRILREKLLRDGEGWLSEESVDDLGRLQKSHVWIVDPLDGTLEFIDGIPEWCVSIGWIEEGRAIAGGVYNPITRELFLGSASSGVQYNGRSARASQREHLAGATVLASRSEMKRGDWVGFQNAPFVVRPVGSVAYKLALVAAGLADATWTLCPKNEWDVAAGVALVNSAGGFTQGLDGGLLTFNRRAPLLPGLVAGGRRLQAEISDLLDDRGTEGKCLSALD
jgi:myo-inositol-1(or 4)-monophosphatase